MTIYEIYLHSLDWNWEATQGAALALAGVLLVTFLVTFFTKEAK